MYLPGLVLNLFYKVKVFCNVMSYHITFAAVLEGIYCLDADQCNSMALGDWEIL